MFYKYKFNKKKSKGKMCAINPNYESITRVNKVRGKSLISKKYLFEADREFAREGKLRKREDQAADK